MTCRDFIEFILDYLSGALPASQRDLFVEHMGLCPDCVAYLNMYQKTVALGKAALADPEGLVPADAPEDLVQAVLAARRSRD